MKKFIEPEMLVLNISQEEIILTSGMTENGTGDTDLDIGNLGNGGVQGN